MEQVSAWGVEPWYISGVLTGYRVTRRGPRGRHDIAQGFVGDCYEPGSFQTAKVMAQATAGALNEHAGVAA